MNTKDKISFSLLLASLIGAVFWVYFMIMEAWVDNANYKDYSTASILFMIYMISLLYPWNYRTKEKKFSQFMVASGVFFLIWATVNHFYFMSELSPRLTPITIGIGGVFILLGSGWLINRIANTIS